MPPLAPPRSPWTRGLITWLAYTLTGIMALSLSPPSDDVSPLYLAAGIGLGAVLGWGRWMAVAVGLGSGVVEWVGQMLHPSDVGTGVLLCQSLVGGLGGGLQVWLAARLVQPDPGAPLPLDKPAQIGRFLLLAGPVACTVNAALSVGSMGLLGIMPLSRVPMAMGGWWLGDTLGVLVGAPLMLTLVGQPAELWRRRRLVVGLPLLITTALLDLSIRQVQTWEREREAAVFNQDVAATANAVKLRLNGYLNALEAMHGIYAASLDVSREEFRRASTHWLETLPGIQGLGWEERLGHAQIPAFEARQISEGLTGFKVYNREGPPPQPGDELVVLRFIEPLAGNEKALGFNVLSTAAPRTAFERSRREGLAVATPGFKLVQEQGDQLGVVVYLPVYEGTPNTPLTRMQANLGAVFMALRIDDALSAMLQGMPDYLVGCLHEQDDSGTRPPRLLGGVKDCRDTAALNRTLHSDTVPLEFAGRHWQLHIWAKGPVPLVDSRVTSWLLALGGVVVAASLGALLLVMTGHARRIEAAMKEARDQRTAAENANRAKSEFLSRMSHELRTPLNAVLGFAQVMELDRLSPLPEAHQPRIKQIQQAGWHLLDMIDDVLDISRIDAGMLRLQAQPLSVHEALAAAGALLGEQASRQGVSLRWPEQPDLRLGVNADPTRLRQVLTNLLSNAIKYNQRGGSVTVSVQARHDAAQGEVVQIAVNDTGLGMTPTQLERLFEPFNRLGRERHVPDGTGIGLVISRHLAVLMGGRLDVCSQEGEGSTFTLTLPAAELGRRPVSPEPALDTLPPPPPDKGVAHHVLYVEDNLANAEVIRAALTARPWVQLSVAPSIEAGLAVLHDRLRGARPELILLDVHLPDASGQELLRLIKANPDTASIPVIMISADATPEQVDTALANGACCYLTKPVQVAALLQQIDELLQTPG